MSGTPAPNTGSFEDLHPEEATTGELYDDDVDTPIECHDSQQRSTGHDSRETIPEAENPACIDCVPASSPGCLATEDQICIQEDANGGNNATIKHPQDENKQLRDELQKCQTELFYARQEHVTAITRKREEIDELQKEHADVVNHLHNTITKLEKEVWDRNKLDDENRSLRLTFEASVNGLTKMKTEVELLTTDRDDQHRMAKFMENEVARLTAESNNLRQRNDDLNKSITLLTTEYKAEILKLNRENAVLKLELVPRQQGSFEHSARRKAPDPLIQTPMPPLLPASRDGDDYSQPEVQQPAQPEVRLSRYDPSLGSPSMRVKRFKIEPSQVMHCRNCGMVSDGLRSHAHRKCSFHAAAPQPYQVWKKLLDSAKYKSTAREHQQDKFWPCCEIISRHEPPGCKVLRHHDLVRPWDPED